MSSRKLARISLEFFVLFIVSIRYPAQYTLREEIASDRRMTVRRMTLNRKQHFIVYFSYIFEGPKIPERKA
jgi:hypothetical protein